jgi:hypothetical protein
MVTGEISVQVTFCRHETERGRPGLLLSSLMTRDREPFDVYIARIKKQHEKRAKAVRAALDKSPAILFVEGDRIELVIVTGDTHPGALPLRATTFLVDGPWGHENYKTATEIADDLAKRTWTEVRAADEHEVIDWTTTPEFVQGSKRVAYVQAANALRYWASQKGYDSPDWKRSDDVLRKADSMGVDQIDDATAMIERELRAVAPSENPPIITNPAWVTRVLAKAYETVAGRVPPAWLPKLSDVRAERGVMRAKMREYGCGAYGCVLPTLDKDVVLKITTDDTEAQFAEQLSDSLVAPICVDYHTVLRLATKHQGRTIYLLWRESAEDVGKLERVLGRQAMDLIGVQHAASQDVLHHILNPRATSNQIADALAAWLDTCDQMADQDDVPDLAPLGRGMASVFREQKIFFGDVHDGNVGRVVRDGVSSWVITDPGNVIVFGNTRATQR